ncbi:aminodeoxychorismate synthase component I [Kitasatospora sp. NBC_01287]|uniref:aminodeoxychorismate synthase component I n=1 Tax=Kitasatospora sp. NBC_01287 TaxID=2903573 RepID=UPI00224F33A8|nr:aminodeoxychorismate synthase component I [Kitasatospora sp. NBC_01287]MCX4745620.1 aminodeoxychorismate synthase component I [Kitasatospora sp. NBC_01287]
MRTLLIDNHDSYTYNLFQLIAEVNGVEPVVVTNDDPRAAELDLAAFDNVVISPGPGHPARPRDFGISARIVREARIPVLGVCLGHQGIGFGEGAEVLPAPEPRHGYLSTVRHDGRELFAGVPQDFTVVRYHSLAVAEPLPPTLQATAWSEDGVVMGLRHTGRPLWGVQFHPESICTEYGRLLLANFRELTIAHHGEQPAPVADTAAALPHRARALAPSSNLASPNLASPNLASPALAPSAALASAADQPADQPVEPAAGLRVHVRTIETAIDAEAAFTELYAATPAPAFWLDSAHVEPGRSRFSFLGDASGPLAETVHYRTGEGTVRVHRTGRLPQQVPGTVFDYLRTQLRRRRTDVPDLPFDFTGGYVGYFGYELKGDLGSTNKHSSPTPDAQWLFADRVIVVDHQEDSTYLLALSDADPATESGALSWLDRTAATLLSLPAAQPAITGRAAAGPAATGAGQGGVRPDAERWLTHDREQYRARIAEIHQQLRAGESYEVCLTTSAWLPAEQDGYDFYRALRRANPAPYAAYLRLPEVEIASSSPERFLTIDRSGVVETKPIKGTVSRAADPVRDEELRASLAASAKTRAENLMIVDLLRNDLGRVCEVGSVHVPRLMATESYTTVHQLVSTIRGRLRPGSDAIDVVRACFPGGSMTGAPKQRTMEIIDDLESEARGVYSGSIGLLSTNGTADLNIVIRTAVKVGDQWRVGAGGAVILDSDPDEEFDEMVLKASAPLRAYQAAADPLAA